MRSSLFWDVIQLSHLPTFRENQAVRPLDCLILEYETDRLSRNVDNYQYTLHTIPEEQGSQTSSYLCDVWEHFAATVLERQ